MVEARAKAKEGDKRLGNQFWKARSSHGRKKIFSDPEVLRAAAEQYFEWVEANPLWEDRVAQYQGEPVSIPVSKMRAMTITAFCRFVHINFDTWCEYKKDKDLTDVIHEIESVIKDQKFAGAAADLLNANIIARDLGLIDKSDQTISKRTTVKIIDLSGKKPAKPAKPAKAKK